MRNRISEMLERDDYHGIFVLAGRLWLERDHPSVEYAVLIAETGEDYPAIQIPIIPAHVTADV